MTAVQHIAVPPEDPLFREWAAAAFGRTADTGVVVDAGALIQLRFAGRSRSVLR
ncbi:hypothetical protein [Amycolatopsis jejuensis]|uniref:hypothetical protein n=1 Tax=Amycolatopsis jejuensis TaxID=330084 RepID=UPI000AFA32D1|nr:hypothetical protein [Amycolatopsis jejuensis]